VAPQFVDNSLNACSGTYRTNKTRKSMRRLMVLCVRRFYDYWDRFESWRDFSLKAAEYNLEEAESREEKRWMTKENEKR
jgi:hypothetical protein